MIHPVRKELLSAGKTFDVHRANFGVDLENVIVKQANARADRVDAAARLSNEFAISRSIHGPTVITADKWLDTTQGPLLVFQDHNLSALNLNRSLPLAASELLATALKMAASLKTIHEAGIVHRDINPSNFVVSDDLSEVRLIDFCIAMQSGTSEPQRGIMTSARGTLDYMPPEQSGRINRNVDQRSDLYSFGITLYELATGQLPFSESQPAALIHRHLTEIPPPAATVNPKIPVRLSDAIARLIEKNPEDRFQTVQAFVQALENDHNNATPEHFKIPDALYGRDVLLQRALKSIQTNAKGGNGLIRVTGPSGSGKSALIMNLVTSAQSTGAIFIQGKFEQYKQSRPYEAFGQACNMLLRKLLSQPPSVVKQWRERILHALSPNAQVLLDLLPEYEKLIDSQPSVAKLGLNESQIRMSMVFRRFVKALSSPQQPIILFIDDLQWADAASRSLIELLLTDSTIENFTIVAAYRDDEISDNHPLNTLFASLHQHRPLAPPLVVSALKLDDVANMMADSLGNSVEAALPLARIVMQKTAGNPFFIRQFLLALVRKNLITYSPTTQRWTSHDDKAAGEQITDNVTSLVIDRILDLPLRTQELIKFAACFGNSFSADDLGLTTETDIDVLREQLAPALQSQIILLEQNTMSGLAATYRFQHDRVQQAAHELLPEDQRSQRHALIAQYLIERGDLQGTRLVIVTDHLIAGQKHLSAELDTQLLLLAIKSAVRTKASNAYQATIRYLDIAEQALQRTSQTPDASVLFKINIERAEVAYLNGDRALAESLANTMLELPLRAIDKVAVLELKTLIFTARLEYKDAIVAGREAIALLGVDLPAKPNTATILAQIAKTKLKLRGYSDADILLLPAMQDPNKMAVMRVLKLLAPPAYFSEPNLLPIIAMTHVRLTVSYGTAPYSGYGFVVYGMMHCAVLGNIPRGLAYGELALKMVSAPGARDIEGAVKMMFAGFIRHWSVPLTEVLPIYLDGADKAFAAGDLEFHAYNRYGHASYALMAGKSLDKVQEHLDLHISAVTEAAHEKTQRIMSMARSSIIKMRGVHNEQGSHFDHKESLKIWKEQSDATSLAYHFKYQLLEHLMVGDYEGVLGSAKNLTDNLAGILSMAYQPFYLFYEALALIETSSLASYTQKFIRLTNARRLIRRLDKWSRHSPFTLQHRVTLLRAEMAAVTGDMAKAISGFESAIELARRSGALHDIGLFQERAGRFYLRQNSSAVAIMHLNAAIDAHQVWGGGAWATSVAERFSQFTTSKGVMNSANTESRIASSMDSVDSQTFILAANALAQKSSLEEVVVEVMKAIVMNAGATRGALILSQDSHWNLVAELQQGKSVSMMRNIPASASSTLPQGIINFVRHAGEQLVLNDASIDETFGNDPYVLSAQPVSVLCAPLVAKGKIVGIIYLENSAMRNAFRADLCKSVEVLATQAAISIDNASLFEKLEGALELQLELTTAHARFVPHSFLELLGRPSIAEVKLGDHIKGEASILFSDMREFTALVERLEPDEAIVFINDYLSLMEPAVLANGGFVDSYIGDALMAVFDIGPQAAIDTAISMIQRLESWSDGKSSLSTVPIKIGIGIASGELIFGTIGAANRLKCGVIGDTVNLASRIEGLTKRFDAKILITENTLNTLENPQSYQIREIDFVTVAGREQPINLFEVLDADIESLREQKVLTTPYMKKGLECYRAGSINEALRLFEQCVQLAPDDPVSSLLLDRCQNADYGKSGGTWDGITRLPK